VLYKSSSGILTAIQVVEVTLKKLIKQLKKKNNREFWKAGAGRQQGSELPFQAISCTA
jgi:hypothetical protein